MTELSPLFESSHSAHTRALLGAGRNEAAPKDFSQRLLVGLGFGAAVSGVSAVASAGTAGAAVQGVASAGSGAASLVMLGAKWVAVGVLGGGILAGSAELAFSPKHAAPAAVLASSRAAAPAREPARERAAKVKVQSPELVEPAPVASAEPEPKASRAASNAAFPSAPPSTDGSLAREVAAIDSARRALTRGDLNRALSELDGFDRVATSGVLDREAKVLRIEVLYKAGQSERARTLSEQYERLYPNDPHTTRLRALEQAAEAR